MNDIQSLESTVSADPADTVARLAWADALDNAGHPLRAAYQRLIAEFHARLEGDTRDAGLIGRFMATADDLGYKELSRYMFQASVYESMQVCRQFVDRGSAVAYRTVIEQTCKSAVQYAPQAAGSLVLPFTPAKMDHRLIGDDVWLIPIVTKPPFTVATQRGLPFTVTCSWWTWLHHSRAMLTHLPLDAVRLSDRPPVRYRQQRDEAGPGMLYLDLPVFAGQPKSVPCSYAKFRSFAYSRSDPSQAPNKFTTALLRKQWPLIRSWSYPRVDRRQEQEDEVS